MKFLLGLLLAFAGTAQAGVVCDLYENTIDYSADMVATSLDCTNVEAVRLDLSDKIGSLNICSEGQEEEGNSFCSRLAGYLVSELRGKVPEAWGCTLESAEEFLAEKLVKACEMKSEL